MDYIQGLPEQTHLFLQAVGCGFWLGVLYSVFRIARIGLHLKNKIVFFWDILYVLLCAVLTFFYLLAVNNGQMTFFILFGELLGWLVYYFSLGIIAIRGFSALLRLLRRVFHWVSRHIFLPVWQVFHRIIRFFSDFEKKVEIKTKKWIKSSKYHLKKKHALQYTIEESLAVTPKNVKTRKGKAKRGKKQRKEKKA